MWLVFVQAKTLACLELIKNKIFNKSFFYDCDNYNITTGVPNEIFKVL